jgi:excisionase family DNA binding protein
MAATTQPLKRDTLKPHSPARDEGELYELLTVDEVAALLKVSRTWVYEHTRRRSVAPADRLPFVKIGKYVRFEPRAVQAFLARKCRAM